MAISAMETYFNELAAVLDRALRPGEVYTARWPPRTPTSCA